MSAPDPTAAVSRAPTASSVEIPAPPTPVTTKTEGPPPSLPPPSTSTTSLARTELTTAAVEDHGTLVVKAAGDVDVFAEPESGEPVKTLDATTILGTATVLVVVDGPRDGWAKVMLPGRPNGSEGWVQTEGMTTFVVESFIHVDLSDRALTYFEGGDEVLSTPVAVGSNAHPTPVGTFFVTDNVTLANPDSPWGPHALGLSGRSDTVLEYNGGDGIIGIHGTNKPDLIGSDASLGCVRVPNDVITRLHETIRIGTPVRIDA